ALHWTAAITGSGRRPPVDRSGPSPTPPSRLPGIGLAFVGSALLLTVSWAGHARGSLPPGGGDGLGRGPLAAVVGWGRGTGRFFPPGAPAADRWRGRVRPGGSCPARLGPGPVGRGLGRGLVDRRQRRGARRGSRGQSRYGRADGVRAGSRLQSGRVRCP